MAKRIVFAQADLRRPFAFGNRNGCVDEIVAPRRFRKRETFGGNCLQFVAEPDDRRTDGKSRNTPDCARSTTPSARSISFSVVSHAATSPHTVRPSISNVGGETGTGSAASADPSTADATAADARMTTPITVLMDAPILAPSLDPSMLHIEPCYTLSAAASLATPPASSPIFLRSTFTTPHGATLRQFPRVKSGI